MHNWFNALCEDSKMQYLSGFVGICLMQYLQGNRRSSAFAVLTRMLNKKVVFTQTVCPHLKVGDVVEIASKVS